MATLREIRDAVDSRLAALLPKLRAAQDTYHARRGKYWQGLRTHTNPPADGASKAREVGNAKPLGADKSWADVLPDETTLPCCLEIHEYRGPQGAGYAATATVVVAGRKYTRTVNVGPETHRAHSWREVNPKWR